ncbi:MAG: hypothetical protein J7K23_01045 [Thermoproteales archaeon]|nr:hypothetical protein [Thermoproteales archaeon]
MSSKNTLSIVSHNAHWFTGLYRDNDSRVSENEILDKFTEVYRKLKVDLLCLQEVKSLRQVKCLENNLSMKGIYMKGVMYWQYGGAILFDESFSLVDYMALKNITRFCQIAVFDVRGVEISICNLHLPSSKYVKDASSKQVEEVSYVLACSQPQIIVGDFNAQPIDKIYSYMHDIGYVDSASLFGKIENTTVCGKRIDYIWVIKELKNNVVNNNVYSNIVYKNIFLSDHFPLKVTIKID